MNIKELIEFLSKYPESMNVRLLTNSAGASGVIVDFDDENTLVTSDTVYLDANVPEEEWDTEEGKRMMGSGEQYLLINPVIM